MPREARHRVRLQAHPSREVQVLSRHTLSGLQTNDNCAVARRGGEQSEVVDQSVGHERDSVTWFDEPTR